MTPFETASLTLSEYTLWVAVASLVAQVIIGTGQIAIVWYGIGAMVTSGAERARENDKRHLEAMKNHAEAMKNHAEAMKKAEERAREHDQRHAESMAALRELIVRTSPVASGADAKVGAS